jgi:hypothetical protein
MSWIYIVMTIIAGCFFYWLRTWCQWLYGLSELVVALLIIILTWLPHGELPYALVVSHKAVPFTDILAPKIVSIFVGVYALVRGVDNIITGLRQPSM